MEIKHRGITASQSNYNNHVMLISEDGNMLMHASCTTPKTEQKLIKMIDGYLDRLKMSLKNYPDDQEE